jgi:hypothetical protein
LSPTVRKARTPRAKAGTSFEGRLDEVALYDRALVADEIAAHLRAAIGR